MRRFMHGAMLALACLGLCTTSAWADLLFGINFQGRIDGTANDPSLTLNALAPTDVAGVLAQDHWNNDPALVSGGTHTLTQLMDSTGTRTSLSLTVSANDSWFSHTGNADPNHTLLNGIIKATAQPATYTFNNLMPGATYKVIAYTLENDGQANNTLTIGSTKYITTAQNGVDFNGTFIRAMNTDPAGTRDVGNYVQFDGVTADENGRLVLTDVWNSGTDGVGIAGIQVQGAAPVPEPTSVVLLGLGAVALIVWRGWGARKR